MNNPLHRQNHGQPLTEQPHHEGRLLTLREQKRLHEREAIEVNHAILDRLVGLEALAEALRHLVGQQKRRVLWSGSALIGETGIWHRRLPQGSIGIFVCNFSANGQATVAANGPLGAAPGPGAGTHNVPAGTAMVFNDETTDWTIYGTPGNVLDVQIFSIPITPMAAGNI